jgi:hypothetical protein
VDVGQAVDPHVLLAAAEAEHVGQRGFAFQNQDGALFHASVPLHGRGCAGASHKNAREASGLPLEADGSKDFRPRAGIVGEDAEVRKIGGMRGARQDERQANE